MMRAGGRSAPDKEGGVILSSMQKKALWLSLLGVSAGAMAATVRDRRADPCRSRAPGCRPERLHPRPTDLRAGASAGLFDRPDDRAGDRRVEQPAPIGFLSLLLLCGLPDQPSRLAGRGCDAQGGGESDQSRHHAGGPGRFASSASSRRSPMSARPSSLSPCSRPAAPDEARAAAKLAWTGGALPTADESRILTTFSAALTPEDHDARIAALLAANRTAGRAA